MDKITKYLTYGSVLLLLYWLCTKVFDIYAFIITGVIYEMTSIFAIVAVYLVLILAVLNLIKKRNPWSFIPLGISIVVFVVIYSMPPLFDVL